MSEIILDRFKFAVAMAVRRESLTGVDVAVDAEVQYISNHLVVKLQKELLSHRIASVKAPVHFEYAHYRSPWQRVKDARAPRWFTRWFPAKFTIVKRTEYVTVEDRATFPLARDFYPEDLGPIVYRRDTHGPGTVRWSE